MSEKTTDGESEPESGTVIDESSRKRGSKRSLLLGVSFIAGYLVGKSQSKSDFREELGEFSGTDGGPMEIEIHDTDSATESDDDGNSEQESDEATEDETDDEDDEE